MAIQHWQSHPDREVQLAQGDMDQLFRDLGVFLHRDSHHQWVSEPTACPRSRGTSNFAISAILVPLVWS